MTETLKIPILDLQPQILAHWDELNAAFQRVLRSGQFILGPEEKAFERECAAYLGVEHAIGLNSGTDALFIALRALNIGEGDEVITTPFSFFATAEAITHVGATPVFVDIQENSFNIDPEKVKAAITPRTKAIIPVHLFGRPCAIDALTGIAAKANIPIVEDCAQSFGARISGSAMGSRGHFGCYSFFPTKNLNAFGDGGLIATNDAHLAELARMLRMHGSRKKYYNEMAGYNSRLDEIQAAMLRIKLPHLDSWNESRVRVAVAYGDRLAGLAGVQAPEVVDGHVFHQYTIRIRSGRRDAVHAFLANEGIGTMIYYPVPIHRLKFYQEAYADTQCPVAEQAAGEVLSLPIWPEMSIETVDRVVDILKRALAAGNI